MYEKPDLFIPTKHGSHHIVGNNDEHPGIKGDQQASENKEELRLGTRYSSSRGMGI